MSGEPVKQVLELRAAAHERNAVEAWIERLLAGCAQVAAVEGSSVLATMDGRYVVLIRFASAAELAKWDGSAEAAEQRRAGARFLAAEAPVVRSGFETWFTLPGGTPPPRVPARWKIALLTWVALLPQVIVLNALLPAGVPFLAAVAITTALPVASLTWLVMPRLTALLHRWLF